MKFTTTIAGTPSGSFGALTASRNRFGSYFRTRVIPTNPNTSRQSAVRAIMAQLSGLWGTTLTAAQRAAWDEYGNQVTVPDKIGNQVHLTGLNHYIRSNVPRLQLAVTRIDDAPTVYNLGDFTPIIAVAAAGTGLITIGFTEADDWVGEDGAFLMIYDGPSVSQTKQYFSGPHRLSGGIGGDSVTPPTTPDTLSPGYTVVEGLLKYYRARVSRADGRLSTVQTLSSTNLS